MLVILVHMGVIESHVPPLSISYSPTPPRFTVHKFVEVDVIKIHIIPRVSSCSSMNHIYILPDFRCPFGISMSINGCIDPEGLVPFPNTVDFPCFIGWRFQEGISSLSN